MKESKQKIRRWNEQRKIITRWLQQDYRACIYRLCYYDSATIKKLFDIYARDPSS